MPSSFSLYIDSGHHVSQEMLLFRYVIIQAIEATTTPIVLKPPLPLLESIRTNRKALQILNKNNVGALTEYSAALRRRKIDQKYFERPSEDFLEVCDYAGYSPSYIRNIYFSLKKKREDNFALLLTSILQQYGDVNNETKQLLLIFTQKGKEESVLKR